MKTHKNKIKWKFRSIAGHEAEVTLKVISKGDEGYYDWLKDKILEILLKANLHKTTLT